MICILDVLPAQGRFELLQESIQRILQAQKDAFKRKSSCGGSGSIARSLFMPENKLFELHERRIAPRDGFSRSSGVWRLALNQVSKGW